jgi:hypothetical protein
MTVTEAIKEISQYGNVEKLTKWYKVSASNEISSVTFTEQTEADIIQLADICKNNKTDYHPLLSYQWMKGVDIDNPRED